MRQAVKIMNGTSTLACLPKRFIDATQDTVLSFDEVAETFRQCMEDGPATVIRRGEIEKGYRVLKPGDYSWYRERDWEGESVISQDGKNIRIVAIIAARRGRGTFSRLITEICRSGLRPVVVTPLMDMEDILVRWNWAAVISGGSYTDLEAQWFPMRPWIIARTAP